MSVFITKSFSLLTGWVQLCPRVGEKERSSATTGNKYHDIRLIKCLHLCNHFWAPLLWCIHNCLGIHSILNSDTCTSHYGTTWDAKGCRRQLGLRGMEHWMYGKWLPTNETVLLSGLESHWHRPGSTTQQAETVVKCLTDNDGAIRMVGVQKMSICPCPQGGLLTETAGDFLSYPLGQHHKHYCIMFQCRTTTRLA